MRAKQRAHRRDLGQAASSTPTRTASSAPSSPPIWQAVALLKAQPHKNFGLKRKDKRDLQTDQLLFSKVFNYVDQVLNVLQPELYLRPEQPMGLALANCHEKGVLIPSFVVGADLLQGRPEKELAFAIAQQLTFMRPEHFLRTCCPRPSQLKVVFLAALKMANPRRRSRRREAVEVGPVSSTPCAARLHAGAARAARAGGAASSCSPRPRPTSTSGTRPSSSPRNRAGFVLCNDLEVAAKMVSHRAGRSAASRQGQDQGAGALLDLRGVLPRAEPAGAEHRPVGQPATGASGDRQRPGNRQPATGNRQPATGNRRPGCGPHVIRELEIALFLSAR